MYMYQVRKLLASRNKEGFIVRTRDNYRTYDAALRKEQIEEITDGEAYLTPTGQDDVIGVLFDQIEWLGEEVVDLIGKVHRMEAGK